jgi:hypothetical protein
VLLRRWTPGVGLTRLVRFPTPKPGDLFSVSPYIANRLKNLFVLNERVARELAQTAILGSRRLCRFLLPTTLSEPHASYRQMAIRFLQHDSGGSYQRRQHPYQL